MCWVVTWDALMQLLLLHVRFTAEKGRNIRRGNTVNSICNWLNLIEIRPSANIATRGDTVGSVPPVL
jgi:hypothetical protein